MRDIPDLIEGLRRIPGILSEFMKTIPDDKMNRRRGDDFWTISEHLSHLAQVQPMLLERVQRFLDEEHPEFVPYIPGADEDEADTPEVLAVSDALDQFARFRSGQLSLLKDATESIWHREAIHPEYDRYSFHILVRHILMHDYWHMYRMEELWLTKDAYLTRLD
jgi:uncharacterized damage-inducible protein DinB